MTNKAKAQLTSDRGWEPGTRPLREGEKILVLVHVPGRTPVAVFTGNAGSFGLAYAIQQHLSAALEL